MTSPTALEIVDQAFALIQDWMHYEDRAYYRVVVPDANETGRLLTYDRDEGQRIYINKETISG